MKKNIIKKVSLITVLLLGFQSQTLAKEVLSPKKTVITDTVKLINLAGKQRMLSQRIVKNYLYAGNHIATVKAEKQLQESLAQLKKAHRTLTRSITNPEIKNLLDFVKMSTEDFSEISNEEFTMNSAQLVIDLSESMLEGSQYVVDSLKDAAKIKESKIVGIAGRQRMLAQRIAKYYIAYQSGIKDKNTIHQMSKAVKMFAASHEKLMKNSTNSPEINRKLNQVGRLWKIVYKFYLNIEKGGLPLIVFNTTDDITNKMNTITKLYVALYREEGL